MIMVKRVFSLLMVMFLTVNIVSAVEPMVVIDEDFSLFTAGSEDAPDSKNIANKSFKVENQYTKEPLWGGNHVYQAGGCALLAGYKDEWDWQYYGHITTPEKELSGDLVVTFRVRRADSNPDNGKLDFALCDNDYGRIETVKYELTSEWQEFKWEYTNTESFSSRCVLQFTASEGEILIDDIKVVRTRNVIEGVSALKCVNISPTEFEARWNKSDNPNISGYVLNVYYMDMPAEYVEPGTALCDFESINLKEDGKIDLTAPGYPEGWTIDVSSIGEQDMSTTAGNYNSGSKALFFDASGDYVLSPVTPAPINTISFWVKPTSIDYESYNATSLVGIWVKYKNGTWEHIANIDNTYMEENGGFFTLSGDQVKSGVNQVKITCEASYDVDFIIDDVTLDYETQMEPYPFIENELVNGTSKVVTGIDPTKEHYYYVQVKEGDILSTPSSHIWVDGISGLTPEVYAPTNVTETGFTANWSRFNNADFYWLRVNHKHVTTIDNEEVLLTQEDFSGLKEGTLSWPHYEWYDTYDLTQNAATEQEWVLTLPCWADGYAGTQGSMWGEPSLIVSPKFKLGNYAVKVDFTAVNTVPNDTIYVMVIDKLDTKNPKASKKGVGFGAVYSDHVSASVTLDAMEWGDEPLYIAFVSKNNNAFFIDEAKISLIVPNKGTAIEKNYKVLHADDNFYVLENLPNGAYEYTYSVIAQATRNFVTYVSNESEQKGVDLMSSIENVKAKDYLYTTEGVLHAVVEKGALMSVYNINGVLVKKLNLASGENTVELVSGIYIVEINNVVYKVVVK